VFLERAGLRLEGKEPYDPWIAQEGARIGREGGTGVTAAADSNRGSNRSAIFPVTCSNTASASLSIDAKFP
jgi:hypothetical protein